MWSNFNVSSMCFYFCLYFLCFYEYILRVCVYKWAYCWGKKGGGELPTYLPYFLVARYTNTTIYLGGGGLSFTSMVSLVDMKISRTSPQMDWICHVCTTCSSWYGLGVTFPLLCIPHCLFCHFSDSRGNCGYKASLYLFCYWFCSDNCSCHDIFNNKELG